MIASSLKNQDSRHDRGLWSSLLDLTQIMAQNYSGFFCEPHKLPGRFELLNLICVCFIFNWHFIVTHKNRIHCEMFIHAHDIVRSILFCCCSLFPSPLLPPFSPFSTSLFSLCGFLTLTFYLHRASALKVNSS